ncbi:MAG: S41 family peptidase [Thermoguttaceae bacterium]
MYRRIFWLLVAAAVWSGSASDLWGATADKSPRQKDDYYELYKILADTMDQVDRNYVKEVDRRELFEAAIKGVMGRLDPYSVYIGPEELNQFRSTVESEFGGIGIHVTTEDGDLRVLSPIYGTPAYRAGILAGDRIVEIDGKSTEGILPDEAVERMKGKEGSPVTLTIIHAGQSQREKITLNRERIHVETVLGDRRRPDDTWDFLLDPQTGTGYIRVTAFSRDTAGELQKALRQLQSQKFRGLILDLRFNPGGLLSSAIEVSNVFISEGRIVSTKGRNSPEHVWNAHKDGAFEGFPMVILVNHYTASASEIVAACLQDHKRAVIVGERTWGKGSVQNVIELEGGRSALKLTTAAYQRPSGKNIHRFPDSRTQDEWGVMPDQGYELHLGDREMAVLAADRRDRDVLQPHKAIGDDGRRATDDGRRTKDEGPRTKDQGRKTDDGGPKSPNPQIPKSPAKDPAAPAAVPVKSEAKPAPSAPATSPPVVKPESPASTAKKKPPLVDRQLELARKCLADQAARAKK